MKLTEKEEFLLNESEELFIWYESDFGSLNDFELVVKLKGKIFE